MEKEAQVICPILFQRSLREAVPGKRNIGFLCPVLKEEDDMIEI